MEGEAASPELMTGADALAIFRALGRAAFGKNMLLSGTAILGRAVDEDHEQDLEIKIPRAGKLGLEELRASVDNRPLASFCSWNGYVEGQWIPIIVKDVSFWRSEATKKISIVEGDMSLANLADPRYMRPLLPKYEIVQEQMSLHVRLDNVDPDFEHSVNVTLVTFELSKELLDMLKGE